MGHSQKAAAFERQKKQQELTKLLARDKELDRLFNCMYEDNIVGKIDDERFSRMSKSYTEEQNDIAVKVKTLRSELENAEEKGLYFGYVYLYGTQIHTSQKANRTHVDRVDRPHRGASIRKD